MTQKFDSLATKYVKLIPVSAPPKNGLYMLANGSVGVAVNGVTTDLVSGPPTAIAADGAINPHNSAKYVITKGSAAVLTLAAPTAGTDDGTEIEITSNTAFAHTITATGLFQCGTVKTDVATFAAFAGATVRLMAYGGKWNVLSVNAVVFT